MMGHDMELKGGRRSATALRCGCVLEADVQFQVCGIVGNTATELATVG